MVFRLTEAELDLIEEAENKLGGLCGVTRPETLGHQRCWRIEGHSGPHYSQDRKTWDLPLGSVTMVHENIDTVTFR